jgi:hypothetical protein
MWYTGTVHTNPNYDPFRIDNPGDIGVVVLDAPVAGIPPPLCRASACSML